jgi:hypothetical protein
VLVVRIDRGQGLEEVFVTNQTERWRKIELSQERVRSILSQYYNLEAKKTWPGFVDRLADWAKEDYPEATLLEASIRIRKTPLPGAEPAAWAPYWKQKRRLR